MNQKKIGMFLKELRKEKQLTQEQTLLKVADYEKEENRKFSGRVCGLFIGAIAAFVLYSVLDILGLTSSKGYEQIASYAMGLVFGALLVGAIYTSRYMVKIQAFKLRVLHRVQKRDYEKEIYEKNGVEKGL